MAEATAGTTVVNAGSGGTTVVPDQNSTGGPSGVQGGSSGVQSGPVVVPANAAPDWTSSLPEASKQYVTSKGFKDPAAVLDSYQNLEKLMGAPKERLLRLPEKMDEPGALNEIYDRLGRPAQAADYKFEAPQGQEANKEFTSWAQGKFHELGLTKAQGEALAKGWNEYAVTERTTAANQRVESVKAEDAALHKEWGKAYDQNLSATRAACKQFGLNQETVGKLEQALGYSATLKFLSQIGSKLGEDSFVTGGNSNNAITGALTPDAARAQIAELNKDQSFVSKYLSGDYESKQKMTRLMEFAYPDMPVEN